MSTVRHLDESRLARDRDYNARTSLANRDKPVFNARHRQTRSQEVPKFYTDSLNTSFASHIPSPSPARPTYGGRPRQARGNNGKGIAAAYNALGGSPSPNGRIAKNGQTTNSNTSPPSRNVNRRSQAHNSPKLPARTKTPSPERGRRAEYNLVSPVSDASASSPPRGLAEAYRRIQDEETLASQETSDDGNDEYLHYVNGELRSRISVSPNSRRSSRRFSPKPKPKAEPEKAEEACTGACVDTKKDAGLDPTSRNSSPFDEEPDDDMASQHERDQERVRSAISNEMQPFRKARRKGLTVENLRRAEAGSQSGSASTGSHSISSKASDLSLNVPNGWGRKGRAGKTWLNRITEDSHNDKSAELPSKESHGSKADSIVDWMEAAIETPLPQGNSDSLPATELPIRDLQEPNVSLSPTEIKLVSRAISTTPSSTPPARLRNAAIDAIRIREIESRAEQEKENVRPSVEAEKEEKTKPPGPLRTLSQELEAANEPLETLETLDTDSQESEGTEQAFVSELNAKPIVLVDKAQVRGERTVPVRSDSRDILRTLARVESNSPSPLRSERLMENREDIKAASEKGPNESSFKRTLKTVASYVPGLGANQEIAETPLLESIQGRFKTPMVTGAWVDTPLPTVKVPRIDINLAVENTTLTEHEQKDSSKETDQGADKEQRPSNLEDTAPKLPGSALAAILEHARAKKKGELAIDNDDTLQLSDSEIESLEELLEHSDNDGVRSRSDITKSSVTEKPIPVGPSIASVEAKDHPTLEPDDYSRLVSKLAHLHSTIRDASKDASALQRRISSPTKSKDFQDQFRELADDHECVEGGEVHDFLMPCEKCAQRNGFYGDMDTNMFAWQVVQIPAPRLWIWGDRSWPQLTRIGLFTITLVALVAAEIVVANAYTPPFSPSSMSRYEYGVYYDMPRPPFILAKLAWRNGLSYVLQPVWDYLCIFMRAIATVLGIDPGVFNHPDSLYDKTQWVYVESWEASMSQGDITGMGSDEYI